MDEITKEQQEKLKEVEKQSKELIDNSLIESALIDNKIEFELNGIKYRIKKPNFKEKQEVLQKRIKKFTELLKNKDYLLEKDLKAQYKERGIDIDELDKKMRNLESERNAVQLKLGESLVKGAPDTDLKALRDQIISLRDQQIEVASKKSSYLEFCIEQQVFTESYTYLIYLISEKFEGENWTRAWNKYEDFENESEELIKTVAYYGALVIKDELGL